MAGCVRIVCQVSIFVLSFSSYSCIVGCGRRECGVAFGCIYFSSSVKVLRTVNGVAALAFFSFPVYE